MKFNFDDFQFDCEQLILTRQGKVISLNEKPALILALFLRGKDKIHSKADILENVWTDRVVTEQVVFQNISHLRGLFGDVAIKTFSKKGYQWQLPLSENKESSGEFESDVPLKPDANNTVVIIQNKNSFLKYGKLVAFLVALSISIFSAYEYLQSNSKTGSNSTNIVNLLPVLNAENKESADELNSLMQSADKIKLISHETISGQALFDSPFQTWKATSHAKQQLLLSYKLYPLSGSDSGSTALRFYLQGEYRGWQGYIVGSTYESLTAQLDKLLDSIKITAYFSLKSNTAALAQLTLLLNAQPDNSLFKQQLIQLHYELESFDLAAALVDNELINQQDALNIGLLHLLKVNIARRNANWLQAEQHVHQAQAIFSELRLPHLESDALIQASWIAFVNSNYRQSIEHLNAAANKARAAREPLQEVKAHLTQSFMASKTKQTALMNSHLDLAKQLIDLHQLNDEHQISVLSNLAWSTKIAAEKLAYNQEVLATPFSELYKYNFYLAAEFVRDELIKQKQFDAALASIKPWQHFSFVTVTRAQVAFAQEQWIPASKHAIEAFTAARIAHETYEALDAALLLVRYQNQLAENFKATEYIDYISENATKRWRRINKTLLEQLAYW
jgi:DNA-binding winged helix-turn-helix (wHTH) protein